MVPPWDFSDHEASAPRDASASAICAGALLELASIHPGQAMRERYARSGEEMLASLNRSYTAEGHPGEEGILLHSVYSKPHNDAVDSSVMWGDWFFLRTVADQVAGPIAVP
jgi:unsaturated chondroitin disaccharide hydrolase